jgi:hypothetical protein
MAIDGFFVPEVNGANNTLVTSWAYFCMEVCHDDPTSRIMIYRTTMIRIWPAASDGVPIMSMENGSCGGLLNQLIFPRSDQPLSSSGQADTYGLNELRGHFDTSTVGLSPATVSPLRRL